MSFRKPFRAVPIRQGRVYRRRAAIREVKQAARGWWLKAAAVGALAGAGSIALEPENRAELVQTLAATGKSLAEARYYPNCASARAAGVAPLRQGQAGYRAELDADGDGIACEPYR